MSQLIRPRGKKKNRLLIAEQGFFILGILSNKKYNPLRAVQKYKPLQINRPLRSRRKVRQERHYNSFSCPQGIAFFMIIRSDQEKSTKKLLAPLRFNSPSLFNSSYRPLRPSASLRLAGGRAQDPKNAKKDIMTAGYRRSQLICTHFFARQGMVLFLIVRSDQEINKTLSALSVFAVQQLLSLVQKQNK